MSLLANRALLLSAAALVSSVAAGEIDPALRAVLDRLPPDQQTAVFVYLERQVAVADLVVRLDRMNATRAFRNQLVVTSLRELAARTQPVVLNAIAELRVIQQVSEVTPFWIFNGFALRGTRAAIERLAVMPEVGLIMWAGSDEPGSRDLIEPISQGPASQVATAVPESGLLECRADYVWNQGFTGRNVIVANVDTGVDGNHPALRARWRGTVSGVPVRAAWFDPVANSMFPVGRNSHGTHTMGTICGDDGAGNQIGMAPGALWIASNPIDAAGTRAQRNIWYNQAIQWCADPDGNPATADDVPDVCSNSWGVRDPANGVGPCSPVFNAALDAAEASTVIFCWANGNEGTTGPRVPADRVASPTNSYTVGALEVGSQTIASFSSRGPSTCATTNNIKPEVSARGVSVRSALIGTTYGLMSGTSMACPHVAGGLALLRDVWSEITVVQAKDLMMRTCDDLGTAGEDNTYGWGRINMQRAYDQLLLERPAVAVSVMGTVQSVRLGQSAISHLVLSSYSAQSQAIVISLEVVFEGVPTGIYLIPPVPLAVPPGFSNRAMPLPIGLFIPPNLDPSLLNRPVEIRGEVRIGQNVVSSAGYQFIVVP
jgi:bacillopeptidase F